MKWILILSFLTTISCASFDSEKKEQAELHLKLGTSFYQNGNLPYALRELLKAEELDSKNPIIQNNLGLIYFTREKFELAIDHLKQAVAMDPLFTDARNNLARVYIEQKKYTEAEKELSIVLNDLTYGNAEKGYINLGLSYFNQNKFELAKSTFLKALEYNKENCISLSYYGRCFFEGKNYGVAASTLDRAIEQCSKIDFDEPHYYSAVAYYRMGQKDKSIARFKELTKMYPQGKYKEKAQAMLDLINKGTP